MLLIYPFIRIFVFSILSTFLIFSEKEKSYKNVLTIRLGYYIINLASRLEREKTLKIHNMRLV